MKKILPIISLCLLVSGCAMHRTSRFSATNPPTQAQIEEAWTEASSPSDGHMRIAPLVGVWDGEMKSWTDAAASAEATKVVARRHWILGQLFVEEEFASTMMGRPFVGRGLFGFNNITKNYESTWADSMCSSQMLSTGSFDPATNSITLTGDYVDPVTKQQKTTRQIIHIIDNDHNSFEMYDTDYAGKQFKALEAKFTRRPEGAGKDSSCSGKKGKEGKSKAKSGKKKHKKS